SSYIIHTTILCYFLSFFFFTAPATTEISTLSLHDALPISACIAAGCGRCVSSPASAPRATPTSASSSCSKKDRTASAPPSTCPRSEEHTSELQSPCNLVCRLLLEKKKKTNKKLKILTTKFD